jgi:ABC-2 type transport system permease protein
MSPLSALVRTDLVLYFSNRRALLVTLAAPILIAAFFGSIMGGPPQKPVRIPLAVVDLDGSEVTGRMVANMKGDANFELRDLAEPAAIEEVRKGKLRAAIVLPKGFGETAPRALFRPGERPVVTVHIDPSQAVTMALVKGFLAQHAMEAVARTTFGAGSGAALRIPFTTQEREVTAAGANRKYNGYSHSFAGMGVQFVLFMGIDLGVGVLLMRRMGLWKRLRAAPVSRRLLLGSRVVSGTVIAMILMAGIYAAAIAIFGVRVDGSWPGLIAIIAAFAVMTATFGLLLASLGRTPEATRGLAILATLLLVMLGGAWVPTFIFPEWLQTATLVVPTRWAVDGLDAMTWRGLGIEAALAPVAVMLGFSAAFAAIAIGSFQWEE